MSWRLSCHCGAAQIDLDVDAFGAAYRCDCSLCARKGAAMASVPQKALHTVQGAEYLTLYQWNTNTAEHYFCKTCGIYTHHRRRIDPTTFGVNTSAVEGFEPAGIEMLAGKNHPSD